MVYLRKTASFLFAIIFIIGSAAGIGATELISEPEAEETVILSDTEDEEIILSEEFEEEDVGRKEETKSERKKNCGYILIGDSRFVMMRKSVNMSKHKNVFIIAKKSQGYRWLLRTAVPEARRIIRRNPHIQKWKLAINLGVNDLGHRENYIKKYKKLANEWELYLISVNPVNNYKRVSNRSIRKFNSAIKKLKKISYIDSYKFMMEKGFCTFDGCHYTKETSKDIFSYIMKKLRE